MTSTYVIVSVGTFKAKIENAFFLVRERINTPAIVVDNITFFTQR